MGVTECGNKAPWEVVIPFDAFSPKQSSQSLWIPVTPPRQEDSLFSERKVIFDRQILMHCI